MCERRTEIRKQTGATLDAATRRSLLSARLSSLCPKVFAIILLSMKIRAFERPFTARSRLRDHRFTRSGMH
jgi:hypothetical protein